MFVNRFQLIWYLPISINKEHRHVCRVNLRFIGILGKLKRDGTVEKLKCNGIVIKLKLNDTFKGKLKLNDTFKGELKLNVTFKGKLKLNDTFKGKLKLHGILTKICVLSIAVWFSFLAINRYAIVANDPCHRNQNFTERLVGALGFGTENESFKPSDDWPRFLPWTSIKHTIATF